MFGHTAIVAHGLQTVRDIRSHRNRGARSSDRARYSLQILVNKPAVFSAWTTPDPRGRQGAGDTTTGPARKPARARQVPRRDAWHAARLRAQRALASDASPRGS